MITTRPPASTGSSRSFRSSKMAAAFKNALAHPIHSNKRNSQYRPPPVNEEQKEREKRFVLDFQNTNSSACPDSNTSDVKEKALGAASKQLKIQDFELVKTLGTGRHDQSKAITIG